MLVFRLGLVLVFRGLPGFERLDDTGNDEADTSCEADERCRVHAQSEEHYRAYERGGGNQREYDSGEFVDLVLRLAIIGIDFDYAFLTVDFGMQGVLGHAENPVRRPREASARIRRAPYWTATGRTSPPYESERWKLPAIHRLPNRIACHVPRLGLQFERCHDFRSL